MKPERLLITIVLALWALTAAPASSQKPGLEKATERAIDAVFEPWNRPDRPGCTFSLAREGEVLYEKGFGMAQLEQPAPIVPGTIFEAGSVSKQFTAAAVVLLAQDGLLSLDDEIRQYLPEVPDFGTAITIRQMLNHTSGLRTFRALVALRGRPDGRAVHTNHEVLELIEQQEELNFMAGEEYLYSNSGYILAALLVERVTGQSLDQFSRQRIFGPLAMDHTQWRDDFTEVIPGRATAYETGATGSIHTNMSFSEVYGNGGLLTTVSDLQRWNRELDRPRVLARDFVQQLETRGRFNDGSENFYALGLEIGEYRGMRQISHSGGTAGYRAYLARYPDDRLSIALLCNDGDLNPVTLSYRAVDAYLGADSEDDRSDAAAIDSDGGPITLSDQQLDSLVGVYAHTLTDSAIRVTVRDGTLLIGGMEASPRPSANGGDARFQIEAYQLDVQIERQSNGAQRQQEEQEALLLRLGNSPKREYTKQNESRPSPEQLAEYAGSFYSDELDVSYSVSVHDEQLWFEGPFQKPEPLAPLFGDSFEMGNPVHDRFPLRRGRALIVGWIARFERDAQGRVDKLFITEGTRIRRLRFERR